MVILKVEVRLSALANVVLAAFVAGALASRLLHPLASQLLSDTLAQKSTGLLPLLARTKARQRPHWAAAEFIVSKVEISLTQKSLS